MGYRERFCPDCGSLVAMSAGRWRDVDGAGGPHACAPVRIPGQKHAYDCVCESCWRLLMEEPAPTVTAPAVAPHHAQPPALQPKPAAPIHPPPPMRRHPSATDPDPNQPATTAVPIYRNPEYRRASGGD